MASNSMILYHGSKSGIKGNIAPISRDKCDFGKGYDLIIGSIANDRMFVVLDRFFNGDITDVALINSWSVLKLGKQYVALTKKACERIIIVDEYVLSGEEREILKQENLQNRAKGVAMAEEICRKYRREGRYFDELIKERD